MRTHTLIGERIIVTAPSLTEAARLVRCSHERYGGGGYPDGLAGEQTPLGARIIFACDAYHAINSDRLLRRAQRIRGPRRTGASRRDAVRSAGRAGHAERLPVGLTTVAQAV
jgi:hypothetical protein